jgi:hypothetical protein
MDTNGSIRNWTRLLRSVALTAGAALALALPSGAQASPPAPNAQTQPMIDGCQRSPGALLTKQSPEWAYVYNTPPSQPAPPPQWVSGVVSSGNPEFQAVHTAGGDLPQGHEAFDFNVNIAPDPAYTFLLGSANYAGSGEETGRLHTEWEDTVVPKFAWPEPGNRIMEKGSWIWDCGHWGTPTNVFSPDYWLPKEGQPCPGPILPDPSQCVITGERTEFHPYRVLWTQREPSPRSPTGENEGDIFASTDQTLAGVESDCAHEHPAPQSPDPVHPFLYGPDYTLCLATRPQWQDVSGSYSFLLPAPPKPSADAKLTFRAVNQGSVNAPAPKLVKEGNGVRVTFSLHSSPGQSTVMAYEIFAGWKQLRPSTPPTHLRVTFDRLEIHRAQDPGCSGGIPVPGCDLESTRPNQVTTPPGDWNLFWDVNGIWGQWAPGNGEFLTTDGQTLLPSSQLKPVDLYVPQGKGWRLYVHGRECDLNALDPTNPFSDCPSNEEAADDNDVQGEILDTYPSALGSLGTHRSNAATASNDPTSTCPDANAEGCYSLTYTVSVAP